MWKKRTCQQQEPSYLTKSISKKPQTNLPHHMAPVSWQSHICTRRCLSHRIPTHWSHWRRFANEQDRAPGQDSLRSRWTQCWAFGWSLSSHCSPQSWAACPTEPERQHNKMTRSIQLFIGNVKRKFLNPIPRFRAQATHRNSWFPDVIWAGNLI